MPQLPEDRSLWRAVENMREPSVLCGLCLRPLDLSLSSMSPYSSTLCLSWMSPGRLIIGGCAEVVDIHRSSCLPLRHKSPQEKTDKYYCCGTA